MRDFLYNCLGLFASMMTVIGSLAIVGGSVLVAIAFDHPWLMLTFFLVIPWIVASFW